MKNYDFDEKKEYKQYGEVGIKGTYKNYTEWDNYIRNKYKNVTYKSIINFKAYLKAKSDNYKNRRDTLVQTLIPFLILVISLSITFPSIIEGITQRHVNLLNDISSTLKNVESSKTIDKELEILEVRIKREESNDKLISYSVIICYILIIFSTIAYYLIHFYLLKKITFYKDYCRVLESIERSINVK
ncbi:hypothetical protein [Lacrimispora sp.]|uniref:hypothetical protein n=1 Tax=Lacrimispora sp. TaxID=2719234 RepID=UPI0028AAE1C7|nr:hypothetical protein [Lacrimispora sp.]